MPRAVGRPPRDGSLTSDAATRLASGCGAGRRAKSRTYPICSESSGAPRPAVVVCQLGRPAAGTRGPLVLSCMSVRHFELLASRPPAGTEESWVTPKRVGREGRSSTAANTIFHAAQRFALLAARVVKVADWDGRGNPYAALRSAPGLREHESTLAESQCANGLQ